MKNISYALAAVLLASGAIVPVASAQSTNANVRAGATTTANTSTRGNATSSEAAMRTETKTEVRATSTASRGNATRTEASARGQLTAEEHRSAVASFVQSLRNVANRAGGIGSEVRVVAQSQMDSASTSARAITTVETRSKLKTFLIGTDYKSIGQLRSEMATTTNNIAKLRKLADEATDASVKAELSAQITALEASQADLEAFVEAHESSFSLFGWFVKLFVR